MILVTGGTGNVGRALVRMLRENGEAVSVLTRNVEKARDILGHDVTLLAGDLTMPDSVRSACAGKSSVFFVPHTSGPQMVDVARDFAREAARSGVKRVVAVSSNAIDIEPPVALGRWHADMEQELSGGSLECTMLRPCAYTSNALRWRESIRSAKKVFGRNGDKRSAPIDPFDIASVAFVALTHPSSLGQTLTLTGPELISPREQVETIAARTGLALEFVEVAPEAARTSMLAGGVPAVLVDALLELPPPGWAGEEAERTSTVREVTGREARPFSAWLEGHLAAFV